MENDADQDKTWDPCKPFLQFTAGLLAIATTLAVATLTILPDFDANDQADDVLSTLYWEFLVAVARTIVAGTILAALLTSFRALLSPRDIREWEDGHYLALMIGVLGSFIMAGFVWEAAKVAIRANV